MGPPGVFDPQDGVAGAVGHSIDAAAIAIEHRSDDLAFPFGVNRTGRRSHAVGRRTDAAIDVREGRDHVVDAAVAVDRIALSRWQSGVVGQMNESILVFAAS